MDVLSRTTARGRDSVEVAGAKAQESFSRGHGAEALVGPETRVVDEEEREPPLEVGPKEGRLCADARDRLQRQEEALDESDGARLADGSVTVLHSVLR